MDIWLLHQSIIPPSSLFTDGTPPCEVYYHHPPPQCIAVNHQSENNEPKETADAL